MYIEEGKQGIKKIFSYLDDDYVNKMISGQNMMDQEFGRMLDSGYPLPGMVIFYGMELKGPIFKIDTKYFDLQAMSNVNGAAEVPEYFINFAGYYIWSESKEMRDKLFIVLSAIISNPNTNQDLEKMVEIAQELFVF